MTKTERKDTAMGQKKRFIQADNLPPRISVLWPLTWWVVLDHFNAPSWLYGVMFTWIGIILFYELGRLLNSSPVDLVGNDGNKK